VQIAIVASAKTSSASIKGTLRVRPAFAHTLMSRFFMGKEVCRSGELDGIFAALLDRPAFVALARSQPGHSTGREGQARAMAGSSAGKRGDEAA
jgi:hypothetical protein